MEAIATSSDPSTRVVSRGGLLKHSEISSAKFILLLIPTSRYLLHPQDTQGKLDEAVLFKRNSQPPRVDERMRFEMSSAYLKCRPLRLYREADS